MIDAEEVLPPMTETQPKVSVIVPIHKTEAYVEKCLRSIMAQSLREIEIVCVDDASPDRSVAIIENLAREDDRIVLIRHDRNLGLGGARNTGIAAARADFVSGVDSDDWIMPDMLARLWTASGNGEADITTCGMMVMSEDGRPLYNVSLPEGHYRKGTDEVDILSVMKPSFCNKIIRKALFTDHGIWFPEHMYFEDLATTPRLVHFARDVRIIADPLYCYVRRERSITNSSSPRHMLDYFQVFDILTDFLVSEGLMDSYRDRLAKLIGESLNYHTRYMTRSGIISEASVRSMRYMILMKLAYLQFNQDLRVANPGIMPDILLKARSAEDLYNMLGIEPGRTADSATGKTGRP